MIRTINSILLAIFLCGGLLSCEKEYSAENGNTIGGGGTVTGTARFTMDGAPNDCANYFVQGTYKAGVATGSSNVILLSVNVTTLGDYTITTGQINGITFEGSGVFTTAGTNVISMTATGTPITAGTFDFRAGLIPCGFQVVVQSSTGTGSGTAVFTYAGAPGNCTVPAVAGTYTAGTALTSANTVVLSVNVTTPGTYNITTNSANGVTFGASGTFTAAGANTITLTSNNTAAAAGPFTYTPGTNGCAFTVTYLAGTGGGGGGATDYIRCITGPDSILTDFSENLDGTLTSQFGINFLDFSGSRLDGANIDLIIGSTGSPITTGDYFAQTGTATKYADILYTDQNGDIWSVRPTGTNNFKITVSAITATRVTGTFSGTLYSDEGTGTTTKTLNAGAFSVPY